MLPQPHDCLTAFPFLIDNDLLYHFLKIRCRMLTPRAGKVCRKFFSLIDIAAHCTAPYGLARRGFFFRFRLDGRLIVGVGG